MKRYYPIDSFVSEGTTWALLAPPALPTPPGSNNVWLAIAAADPGEDLKAKAVVQHSVFTEWWPL